MDEGYICTLKIEHGNPKTHFCKGDYTMAHPKMDYTYVGIDSHKATHTAVFLDCFFEKLGEITFNNRPSEFPAFLRAADRLKADGTSLLFGLEDTGAYGRALRVFLTENGQEAKHVNAFLVASERKGQTITQKTDSVDAWCVARVLLSKASGLPDARDDNKYWILRTLVVRRGSIVSKNRALKNHLHTLLMQHYPNYSGLFPDFRSNVSVAFFMRYPSPSTLKGTTKGELAAFLLEATGALGGAGIDWEARAREILDSLEDTTVPFQEIRDEAVRSVLRQMAANHQEIERAETDMAVFYHEQFDCTLTSMSGIDIVTAAQMLSCIGDVGRFPTPAKLAQYAGIAPVTYASGQKNMQFANKRGHRELNSLFHQLAVRLINTPQGRIVNPFFYEYYNRKMSEGKTKMQALKCVQRRLVNIVWAMLTNGEEYVNPPTFKVPEEPAEYEENEGALQSEV
jgi:transposase